jgi:hypothetical protein
LHEPSLSRRRLGLGPNVAWPDAVSAIIAQRHVRPGLLPRSRCSPLRVQVRRHKSQAGLPGLCYCTMPRHRTGTQQQRCPYTEDRQDSCSHDLSRGDFFGPALLDQLIRLEHAARPAQQTARSSSPESILRSWLGWRRFPPPLLL